MTLPLSLWYSLGVAAVRVLIVDDQALFRQGLSALLSARSELQVVGEAGSARDALALCERHKPQVVLMDMRMPGMDGAAATRALLAQDATLRVIALTTFDDDQTVFEALRAGAVGYLLKDIDPARLLEAILTAARGEAFMQPSVLSKLVAEFARISQPNAAPGVRVAGLSDRELSVLRLLSQGMSNKEIGNGLNISEGTVKNHVTSIFTKLDVDDRTSAALKARTLGIHEERS